MSFIFDSGYLFGMASSTSTPIRFGSLQGIETSLTATLNKAGRTMQFAGGVQTISDMTWRFTAKVANINGLMFSQLFFGQTPTAGSQAVARDILGTIPASGPYTITSSVPNSGTWVQDLGVQYTLSGIVLTPVAGTPASGQYSVTAGVYTFAAADAGLGVTINYLYHQSTGNSLVLTNPWKGLAPTWQAVLNTQYNGKQVTWNLARCSTEDFSIITPLEDFAVPQFKFQAYGDANGVQGRLGTFSFAD